MSEMIKQGTFGQNRKERVLLLESYLSPPPPL